MVGKSGHAKCKCPQLNPLQMLSKHNHKKTSNWNLSLNPICFSKYPHHTSYHVLPTVCPLPNRTTCVLSGRSQPDGAMSKGLVNQLRQGAWTTARAARAHLLRQGVDRVTWRVVFGVGVLWVQRDHGHVLIICLLQTTNKPRANGNIASWFGIFIHNGFKHLERWYIFTWRSFKQPKLYRNGFLSQSKTYSNCHSWRIAGERSHGWRQPAVEPKVSAQSPHKSNIPAWSVSNMWLVDFLSKAKHLQIDSSHKAVKLD